MKARLKENKKVVVDVAPFDTLGGAIFWIDKDTHKVYTADELVFIEYYGG